MNLFRALATVSSFTLLSRVTGLIRDMLISRLFGASAETDAFNVAFRLPNLLRRLFGEGAFQQAFVPMLADVRSRGDEPQTTAFAGHVASALFWVLLMVSVLGVVGAPVLVWLIASGLARDPATFDLATVMTRWMFPYILFMSLVALAAGVLNTYKRFAVPAFTPVLLNLAFVGVRPVARAAPVATDHGAGVCRADRRRAATRPAVGCAAACRPAPAHRDAAHAFADPDVRRVAGLMLPAIFAVSVAQLSIIINTNIASHLTTGSVTWLSFADRLMEFPTALRRSGPRDDPAAQPLGRVCREARRRLFATARLGLRLIFLLALPAALGLGLLAEGIVSVLFQGREFTAHDVHQTSIAVIGYAVGLIGLIAVKILAPGFYAQKDIRTPVKIAITVLIATQIANLVLVPCSPMPGWHCPSAWARAPMRWRCLSVSGAAACMQRGPAGAVRVAPGHRAAGTRRCAVVGATPDRLDRAADLALAARRFAGDDDHSAAGLYFACSSPSDSARATFVRQGRVRTLTDLQRLLPALHENASVRTRSTPSVDNVCERRRQAAAL